MKCWNRSLALWVFAGVIFFAASLAGGRASAGALPRNAIHSSLAASQGDTATAAQSDYVGSDTCATCHEDQSKRFNNTVMGKAFAHPRNADEKRGCESCHGPGRAHVDAGGGADSIPIRFTKDSKNSVEEMNSACLTCHSKGNRLFWKGSPHESRAMTCVHCHVGHGPSGEKKLSSDVRYNAPLTENLSVKKQQPELCLECHQMRRAQLQRSSHMPYREGKVTCTSCHNPHGTPNPKQLIQSTTNETCLSCHPDRRGPFLYEHPPVMENCANCHEAHGTNNPQLLKVRMPRVCDSCHVASRHPTTPTVLNSVRDFNRGCTNCHSRIHGSNHPSGKFFFR
jgi:DmsE family decaheme c-type cytochrome